SGEGEDSDGAAGDSSSGDSSQSDEAASDPVWAVNGAPVPADNSTFTSLMAQMSSLAFDACWNYKGETDTVTACGLGARAGVLTGGRGGGEAPVRAVGPLGSPGESSCGQSSGDPAVYLLPAGSGRTLTALAAEALTASAAASEEAGYPSAGSDTGSAS